MKPKGREKVTAHDRRNIVLAVLNGETQMKVAEDYGLDNSHVSRLVKEARTMPERNLLWTEVMLEDAKEEVKFRKRVIELLAKKH